MMFVMITDANTTEANVKELPSIDDVMMKGPRVVELKK